MKLILFDFDGVIVNTFDMSHKILSTLGSGSISKKDLRRVYDNNPYDSKEIKERFPNKVTENNTFFQQYIPRLLKRVPKRGITPVIKKLADKYTLIIVSSTVDEAIASFLEQADLKRYFKKIYGVNSEKSKVKKIQLALKESKTKPEDAIYITDTLGDIREAAEAGIRSIGVTWGYQKKTTLQKGNPLAVVDAPRNLLQYIYE